MEDPLIAGILGRLGSPEAQEAWAEFLQAYSPLILQVVRLFERDPDYVSDCFLFACEQLSRGGFRRLRSFRPQGPAKFSTWLRAVTRNLCLDWRRQEFGRHRVFQSVARLPALDREVFRCVYEQGMAPEETFLSLRARFSRLEREQVAESEERIRGSLTPRQIWLLGTRRPRMESLEGASEEEEPAKELQDLRPNPEAQAAVSEERAALAQALSRLSKPDRLLLRLRFEQGLTLDQVARLTGIGGPQAADRRIREVLERLRRMMGKMAG